MKDIEIDKRAVEKELIQAAMSWYRDRSKREYTANNKLLNDLFKACKKLAAAEELLK